jgi:poly(hydroxyalkanoate) depolymerase family esterase
MAIDLKNMLTATRLTAAGRVMEATAFLQHLFARNGAGAGTNRPSERRPDDGKWPSRTVPEAGAHPRAPRRLLPPESVRDVLEHRRRFTFKLLEDRQHAPAPSGVAASLGRARFLTASFSNAAGIRPYKIYVPGGYRGQPVPLIVMLHGCTQSPDDFAAGTRMNLAAEEETCIVVYPAQTTAANGSKCWNWFTSEHQQRDHGEPSLIAGITRSVMAQYAIDPRRVYAAGLSAGGAAAAVLGEAYPDLYAAIGVHSGLACGSARDLASALAAMRGGKGGCSPRGYEASVRVRRPTLPVIVFHGDDDKTVHPINGDDVIAAATGATSFEKSVQHGSAPGGRRYTRTLYTDASGQTTLEQWVVHGGGHAWAGGDASGSYTDPRGPDATREMMRFFREHPRVVQ